MAGQALSDKALSILTFAAYHALASGEKVRDVVIDDGKGHHADMAGVDELRSGGLLDVEDSRARLTETGESKLEEVLAAIRSAG